MALLSQRAYAKHRGCTLSAVQKAIRTGRIQLDADGQIDSDQADANWQASTDPSKQRKDEGAAKSNEKKPDPVLAMFTKAKAARETYVAQIKQIEFERLAGSLVLVDEVHAHVFAAVRIARDALLNLPNRISAELASETDPHKVYVLLTKEITQCLEDLAHAGGFTHGSE